MSFLKPLKLENYIQIQIQFQLSFTKQREVDIGYNKERIKWNGCLLQPQLNENLNAKQAALHGEQLKFTTISVSKEIRQMKKMQQINLGEKYSKVLKVQVIYN